MSEGKSYIGTSGWSYPHWAGGLFYPAGLKSRRWLSFLAEHFPTVEVNSSFYRLPPPGRLSRWRGEVGRQFRFALKLWRRVTHLKHLANCGRELEAFFQVSEELGPKRGPLLVQLPPSLRCDLGRLEAFFHEVEKTPGHARCRVAVEFRNPDWLRPEAYRLLEHRGAALCLADMPECAVEDPNDVSFVYVRRHGPGGRYRGCYSGDHIARDAGRVKRWLAEGRDVFVYYNNDVGGYAVDNARQLLQAVQGG